MDRTGKENKKLCEDNESLSSIVMMSPFQSISYENFKDVAKLQELMSHEDLLKLDLQERERQLVAREAATERLEERGRLQELAAREAALHGKESTLAIKERELHLIEKELAMREAEAQAQIREDDLKREKHQLQAIGEDLNYKLQQQYAIIQVRGIEIMRREEHIRIKEKEIEETKNQLKIEDDDLKCVGKRNKEEEEKLKLKQKELAEKDEGLKTQEEKIIKAQRDLEEKKSYFITREEKSRQDFEAKSRLLDNKSRELTKWERKMLNQQAAFEKYKKEANQELLSRETAFQNNSAFMHQRENDFSNKEKTIIGRLKMLENDLKYSEEEQKNKIKKWEEELLESKKAISYAQAKLNEKDEYLSEKESELSKWEETLKGREKVVQEHSIGQEEHLRIILEKEKVLDDLTSILQQKETEYQHYVQNKEGTFQKRERSIQEQLQELYVSVYQWERKANDWEINMKSRKGSNTEYSASPNIITACKKNPEISIASSFSKGNELQEFSPKTGSPILCQTTEKKAFTTGAKTKLKFNDAKGNEEGCSDQGQKKYQVEFEPCTEGNKRNICSPQETAGQLLRLTSKEEELLQKLREDVKQKKSMCYMLVKENEVYSHTSSFDILPDEKCLNHNNSSQNEQVILNNLHSIKKTFSTVINHKQDQLKNKNTVPKKESNVHKNADQIEMHLGESGQNDFSPSQQVTLQEAATSHRLELAQLLIERGATVDGQDANGYTALHWAAKQGHLALVRCLADAGANLNCQSTAGHTAVHLAAMEGRLEVVQYLVDHLGADADIRDCNNETALHLAAEAGWLEIVKFIAAAQVQKRNK